MEKSDSPRAAQTSKIEGAWEKNLTSSKWAQKLRMILKWTYLQHLLIICWLLGAVETFEFGWGGFCALIFAIKRWRYCRWSAPSFNKKWKMKFFRKLFRIVWNERIWDKKFFTIQMMHQPRNLASERDIFADRRISAQYPPSDSLTPSPVF